MFSVDGIHARIKFCCSDQAMIQELASELIEISTSKPQIIFETLTSEDSSHRGTDLSKARILGISEPKFYYNDRRVKTFEYIEKQI